ncbi:uncharacterized protein [Littorina saxatilis]|uniref:Death domain-containing protein n=1 Tax=Littorina saxatilis TaxID=31220 RepID=A0AAN9BCL5_9CAEN
MAEEGATPTNKPKELETLSKTSLVQLARGLGKEPDSLTFPMLLNLPTTTIINLIYDNNENGLIGDESCTAQIAVIEKCILLWRQYTAEVKNKERIKTLEKALREMGKNELADAIMERSQNHQEISADMFA